MPHFREAEPQLANKLEQLLRDFSEGRAGALPAEPSVGDGPDGPPLLGTETEGAPSSEPRQTAPTAAEQLAQPPAPETPADAPVVRHAAGMIWAVCIYGHLAAAIAVQWLVVISMSECQLTRALLSSLCEVQTKFVSCLTTYLCTINSLILRASLRRLHSDDCAVQAEPASPVQDEQIPVATAAAALGGPTPDAPADPPAAAPAVRHTSNICAQ